MKQKIVLIVAVIFLLIGCSYFGLQLKSFEDMNPKEKATLFNKLYVAQYDDYMTMAKRPDLTDDQRSILRTKKDVLVRIQPLLLEYSNFVAGGLKPSESLEKEILKLLNELGSKVG